MIVRNPVRDHDRVKQIFAKKENGVGNSCPRLSLESPIGQALRVLNPIVGVYAFLRKFDG